MNNDTATSLTTTMAMPITMTVQCAHVHEEAPDAPSRLIGERKDDLPHDMGWFEVVLRRPRV